MRKHSVISAPHLVLAGLALTFLASLLAAQERQRVLPPAADRGGAGQGGEDFIFLTDSRPVLLRFRVEVDGKRLGDLWNDYARRWFAYLDRNGDGVLDKEEAKHIPSPLTLQRLRQVGYFLPIARGAGVRIEADADGDGQVTQEELLAYFRSAGLDSLEIGPSFTGRTVFSAASDALFKLLDPDNEGMLTREKVQAIAPTLLKKLDLNDDEILTPDEIAPDAGTAPGILPAQVAGRPGPAGLPSTFYRIPGNDLRNQLGAFLLVYFDKD